MFNFTSLRLSEADNGLSPRRRQAIIWNNIGILLVRILETKLNEILIEIQTFT